MVLMGTTETPVDGENGGVVQKNDPDVAYF